MDDQTSTKQDTVFMADEPMSPEAMTAELKAEFARLESHVTGSDSDAVRRAREALDALDDLDPNPHGRHRDITSAIERAFLALHTVSEMVEAFGPSDFFTCQSRYWATILAHCLSALAKFNSLLARSQDALLRVPLFEDGPELSGYKHRLR
jgi:hypothetical protein